ncbi:MAG: hypothetical protein U0R78_18375 [Nocardioidaceae bacterium]
MAEERRSWGRSLIEGIAYPVVVLTIGVVLAAGVSPLLVERWDKNAPVPNVFDQTEAQARAALESVGFHVLRSEGVCSSSVGPGRVREVLVDNSAPVEDETSLVNKSTDRNALPLEISKDTPLVIKVGNGSPC